MDGRSHVFALVLALAGTGLAGCIENPDWLNTDEPEVSALENRGVADRAATQWDTDAVLIGVMAFELTDSADARIDADPDPGNGLAPAWWYVYVADGDGDDSSVRAFKVAADGTLTSENEAEAFADSVPHDMAEAIHDWNVDSDAAIATAKTNDVFRVAAEGFNATVVEGIAHHDAISTWWISAMSADGFAVATIDANTGELLDVSELGMDFDMPKFEWGAANPEMIGMPVHLEGEGTATASDAPLETPFTTTGPVWGMLTIEYDPSFPSDGLHWAILDGEGEIVAVDHVSSWRGDDGQYEGEIEIPDAGDYTLSLSYMSSFPAPGFPLPMGGAVEYAFVMDLVPGEPEHDEEHEH